MRTKYWHVSSDFSSVESVRVMDDEDRFVMRLDGIDLDRGYDQANVKLAVAAPLLLEALRALEMEASVASVHVWKTPQWDGLAKAIMGARKAIEKAIGEPE